jgi:hypothetical protein
MLRGAATEATRPAAVLTRAAPEGHAYRDFGHFPGLMLDPDARLPYHRFDTWTS